MSHQATSGRNELAIWSIGMWETFFWIQTVQVGVGVLSLPRVISEEAGHSSWIALPLSGLGVQVALWIMVVLMRRFEPLDLFDILRLLFGKILGNVLGGLFTLYCVTACGLVVRTYVELIQTWLFPTTSTLMFYLLLLLPIFYLGTTNARAQGRFGILAFLATIWMAFLLFKPMQEIQFDYYLPLFDTSVSQILKATLSASHAVSGYEVLLVFYPFIQDKKKALKILSGGIWFTIAIYLFITLVAFGFYSEGQLKTIISPTVQLLQIVQLPMIERIEHIGIAAWSFLVVSTAASYIWAGGRFLRQWKKMQSFAPFVLLIPLLWMSYWPREMYSMHSFAQTFGYIGSGVGMFLPLFLLLVAIIRGKKGAPKPSQEEERKAS